MRSEFVSHAYAEVIANVFTPLVEDFCQITNPAPGLYRVTRTHNDVDIGDLSVTVAVNGTALIYNVSHNTNAITDVVVTDSGGIAAAANAIWITVERVPRVQ